MSHQTSSFFHHDSFFAKLPYDIRAIIYSYLEYSDTPPFAPRNQSAGFLLSCRTAKQELDELASANLSTYLSTFQKTSKIELEVHSDPKNPRNLTVTLPFTAFKGWSKNCPHWERQVLASVHPLLSQHFSTVRIHISSNPTFKYVPSHETLWERGQLEVGFHGLLRDLSYMIERVNDLDKGRCLPSLCTIFKDRGEPEPYPATAVRVKRIGLSWDLRPTSSEDLLLNGKMHHLYQRPPPGRRFGPGRLRAFFHGFGMPELDRRPEASFYRVRDTQHLVGEMGIISPGRWNMREDLSPYMNKLLNAASIENEGYVSSDQLGGELKRGLKGCTVKEFEEQESEIENVLWKT